MEAVVGDNQKLVVASMWCAILGPAGFVAIVALLYLADSHPVNDHFLNFFMVMFIGAIALPFVSFILALLAHWQNYRGSRSAAGKAAANRAIEYAIVSIILLPIVGLFFPSGHHSLIGPNEHSAVGSLRILNTATHAYAMTHPERGFPAALEDLSRSHNHVDDPYVIDDHLSSGIKSGYQFMYTPRSTQHDGKLDAYNAIAEPVVVGTTGNRYFFTDESGVVSFGLSRDPAGK